MEEQLKYCSRKCTLRPIWPTSDANVVLRLVLLHIGPFHQLITQFGPGQSVWCEKEAKQLKNAAMCQGCFFFGPNEPNYGGESTPRLAFIFFSRPSATSRRAPCAACRQLAEARPNSVLTAIRPTNNGLSSHCSRHPHCCLLPKRELRSVCVPLPSREAEKIRLFPIQLNAC